MTKWWRPKLRLSIKIRWWHSAKLSLRRRESIRWRMTRHLVYRRRISLTLSLIWVETLMRLIWWEISGWRLLWWILLGWKLIQYRLHLLTYFLCLCLLSCLFWIILLLPACFNYGLCLLSKLFVLIIQLILSYSRLISSFIFCCLF